MRRLFQWLFPNLREQEAGTLEFDETDDGPRATLPLSSSIGAGSDAVVVTSQDLYHSDGDWYTFKEKS